MRIAIVTDAWFPQVNGVVRSLVMTVSILQRRGYEIELVTPDQFATLPIPGYREIRLAVAPRFRVRKTLGNYRPDIVHIVTEGPIGWAARSWCISRNVPFTTAFHTRFPDYAAVRTGISADRFWPIMRRFHKPARAVLVSTFSLIEELEKRGIRNSRLWSRGIDKSVFRPGLPPLEALADLPRPILLSVGRVASEKNLPAFLNAPVAGTKVIVGDGPALAQLRARFPDAIFLGALFGEELARAYCSADVFVFPSRTDTFGLVVIEALACGLPVAAYPVAGPIDILGRSGRGNFDQISEPAGVVDESLSHAIVRAQSASPQSATELGSSFDWEKCTDQFLSALIDAVESPSEEIQKLLPA
jgi:glycosyltransferase involved in cell wall biosynthesis